MDPKSLSIGDIQQWASQAPPEQVVQATHKLLDRVAGFDDTHRENFGRNMSDETRGKLFTREPANV